MMRGLQNTVLHPVLACIVPHCHLQHEVSCVNQARSNISRVQEREEARLRRFRESQFMDSMRDSARPPHRRGAKDRRVEGAG